MHTFSVVKKVFKCRSSQNLLANRFEKQELCPVFFTLASQQSSCDFLANVHLSVTFEMKWAHSLSELRFLSSYIYCIVLYSILFTCSSLFPIPASCIQVNSLSVCFSSWPAQLSEWVKQPAGRLSTTPLLQEELSLPHRPAASSCSCSWPTAAH